MNVFRKKSVEQTLAETGESGHALKRDLTWWDLAIMGVAVAVGAGIFSIGAQAAAFHAGPAVVLSFLIAGVVCGAAVMCYAEFASMIPVAGSAYTFTYSTCLLYTSPVIPPRGGPHASISAWSAKVRNCSMPMASNSNLRTCSPSANARRMTTSAS